MFRWLLVVPSIVLEVVPHDKDFEKYKTDSEYVVIKKVTASISQGGSQHQRLWTMSILMQYG